MPRRLALALIPFAIAVTPVLSLWSNNLDQVDPEVVRAPFALALGLAATLLAISWALLRATSKAAFLASLMLIAFYVYGYLIDAVAMLGWFDRSHADWILGGVYSVLLLGVVWRCLHTRSDLVKASAILGAVALAMITFSVVQIVGFRVGSGSPERLENGENRLRHLAPIPVGEPVDPILEDSEALPDIYYIVPDGYARDDVLSEFYHHDNSGFLDQLRNRGFYIAEASSCNYSQTDLSLASSLNSIYLDSIADLVSGESQSYAPTYWLIGNNWVGNFLRSKGYRYAQIYTNWVGTESSDIADLEYAYVPRWMGSEFAHVLLGTTALHGLRPDLAEFHLYGLNTISQLADVPGPTFLFAHVLMPHNPYIFDREGNARANVPLHLRRSSAVKRALQTGAPGQEYADQLAFLNRKILQVVDDILERSPFRPIIIIQGDHGWEQTRFTPRDQQPTGKLRMISRMSILNAYYVPEEVRRGLYASITPVNTFRLLLSRFFEVDLELLPDRNYYFFPNEPSPPREVTGLVARIRE